MNATIDDLRKLIREKFWAWQAIDEGYLREMFSYTTHVHRGISPLWIQRWLDEMRRAGELRMEGFKYFRNGH